MLLDWIQKTVDGYFALIPRDKPSVERVQYVRLIAHRGAHNYANNIIENTLPAFQLAKKLGCWGVEFDIRLTADNVLVVNHDATLKRLWGHKVAIANLHFSELRALVPDVPTLNEVIAVLGESMHLFIELKTPFQNEEVLVEALKGLSAVENYHLITLNPTIFYSLSKFPKNALLLVAAHNNVHRISNIILNEDYGGILGHYVLITNKVFNQFIVAQKIVGVGMVDSKYSLYRELNRGINWLFTDRAEEVNFYLPPFSHTIA